MNIKILFNYFVKIFSIWIVFLQIIEIPCGGFCLFDLGLPLEKCDLNGLLDGTIYFWCLLIISNSCYSIYCLIAILLIYVWSKCADKIFTLNFIKITSGDLSDKRLIHKKLLTIWVTCGMCIGMATWMELLGDLDFWLLITYISSLIFNTLICSYFYRYDFKSTKYCHGCSIEDYPQNNSDCDSTNQNFFSEITKKEPSNSRVLKSMCKVTCNIILLYNMIHIIYDALDISLRNPQNNDQIRITMLYIISFILYRISICSCLIDIA